MATIILTIEEFQELQESNSGICTACGEISESFCEPDARNYLCDSCGKRQVYGMDELLLSGAITLR